MKHPRITFHFTPTSASWMDQIETWFGILTSQAIRRGSFGSVRELIAMIGAFTRAWNEGASPFTWVETADQILAKAVREPPAASESRHQVVPCQPSMTAKWDQWPIPECPSAHLAMPALQKNVY